MTAHGPLELAYQDVKAGRLSRRAFLERAAALGIGVPLLTVLANSLPTSAAAQDATPEALPGGRPDHGTASQERGAGGELRLLQWQAVSTLSPHQAVGGKDYLAGALIFEPLISFLPDGSLGPALAREVPTIENGGLAPDLAAVTYHLLEGVLWSDGTPFTAHDVAATYAWIVDPANGAVSASNYAALAGVEAIDDLTVQLTFKQGTLAWFIPFSGTATGYVYPKHILDQGEAAHEILRTNPVGTAPYRADSFFENDQVTYVINEHYREPNKPYFATINLKGGGDPTSAARAVLETGDWDFAANPQVEPEVLRQLEAGGFGRVNSAPGGAVEAVFLNFSDPWTEVNGQRSEKNTPHPILSDPAVRKALDLASDRVTISEELYLGAPGEPAGRNTLHGIPAFDSPNTSFIFDVDAARATLDEAGWTLDGSVRVKDGVRLTISLATTINTVRQKTQAVLRQDWTAAGFDVELVEVDGSIFFDSSPGNDQSWKAFYQDALLFTHGTNLPFPIQYLHQWYAGEEGANISQVENNWTGANFQRFVNAEYDELFASLGAETDQDRAATTIIRLNDILWEETAVIPLVQRAASLHAIHNRINNDNIAAHPWEVLYWNIANWNLAPE